MSAQSLSAYYKVLNDETNDGSVNLLLVKINSVKTFRTNSVTINLFLPLAE